MDRMRPSESQSGRGVRTRLCKVTARMLPECLECRSYLIKVKNKRGARKVAVAFITYGEPGDGGDMSWNVVGGLQSYEWVRSNPVNFLERSRQVTDNSVCVPEVEMCDLLWSRSKRHWALPLPLRRFRGELLPETSI